MQVRLRVGILRDAYIAYILLHCKPNGLNTDSQPTQFSHIYLLVAYQYFVDWKIGIYCYVVYKYRFSNPQNIDRQSINY